LLHTSAGRIEVRPNSPNVVPAEAVVFAELRSPEPEMLAWAETELARQIAAASREAGVRHAAGRLERRSAGRFDAQPAALAADEATALGHAARRLDTIAGHDAVSLAAICPTAMLVVPSVGGVCHNPAEFTRPADVALGAELLTRTLARLCRDGVPAWPAR
jgi:N-carbamoyl-L-amino-acid hydrolase